MILRGPFYGKGYSEIDELEDASRPVDTDLITGGLPYHLEGNS
jgi:hypothetical protein